MRSPEELLDRVFPPEHSDDDVGERVIRDGFASLYLRSTPAAATAAGGSWFAYIAAMYGAAPPAHSYSDTVTA